MPTRSCVEEGGAHLGHGPGCTGHLSESGVQARLRLSTRPASAFPRSQGATIGSGAATAAWRRSQA